jgi:hypothetical protein
VRSFALLTAARPVSRRHSKQFNMTGLVIILIAFSICFPFVKLLWVAWLMVWPTTQRFRLCQIKWLGQLGRWSLLDIYVALIILMMITDQQNLHIQVAFIQIPAGLSADVGAGMLLFPLAILCSIAAVAILELAIDPIRCTPHEPRPPTLLCADAVVSGGTCVLSALMGLVATFVAFFSPLFTIKQLSPNVLGTACVLNVKLDRLRRRHAQRNRRGRLTERAKKTLSKLGWALCGSSAKRPSPFLKSVRT